MSNFCRNAVHSSGLPIPTRTTRAPALSKSSFRERNCATCSRQNGQPKCLRNTSTNRPCAQSALSRVAEPSAMTTITSLMVVAFKLIFRTGLFRPRPFADRKEAEPRLVLPLKSDASQYTVVLRAANPFGVKQPKRCTRIRETSGMATSNLPLSSVASRRALPRPRLIYFLLKSGGPLLL